MIDGSFGTKTITIDGPSSDQDVDIALGDLTLEGLKLGAYTDDNNQAVAVSSLSSVANAEDAVARLETALATLETERSNQLSKVERFDFTISHLGNMIRMNEEAVATISDFDEAAEMANLTSYQIEQQTALALMAQAQQLSASVLQLLGG